jgi:hypothetical protein
MDKRKGFFVAISITAMLVTVGLVGCSGGQLTTLEGVIESLDTLSGIVTIEVDGGSTLNFNLAEVKAETIAETLGVLVMEPGDTVIVKLDGNGEVKEIEGNSAKVWGIIEYLDTDSVTVAVEGEGDITLQVTPDTKIEIEDEGGAGFEDLEVGQLAKAKYDVISLEALEIEVENGDEQGVVAVITAIDAGNYTVTIMMEEEGDIVLQVTPDTKIEIEGEGEAGFEDLEVGQRVKAKYDTISFEALEIEVLNGEEEDVEGVVTAIDTGNYRLTITTQEEEELVLQVTSDTKIEIEDEGTAIFADIELGLEVKAKYDVISLEALEIEAKNGH